MDPCKPKYETCQKPPTEVEATEESLCYALHG